MATKAATETTPLKTKTVGQATFIQQSPAASEGSASDTKQLIEQDDGAVFKSSIASASFNYINSIIGSGVIGMAYALKEAGFGFGLILLLVVAVITDYSLVLMVRSGHLCGAFSYQGIMHAAFGRPGYILLSTLQFFYPFIAMVSYNIVVGDTVTKVLIRVFDMSHNSALTHRELVTLVATLLITLPLCLQRDVARLSRVSFMSLVFVGLILAAIIARAPYMEPLVPPVADGWRFAKGDVVQAVGIMAFAFMCHHNTFLIYHSMEDASQRRWDTVTHISVGVSALISFAFGAIGYATFTDWAQGDLLENYCWSDDLMNGARVLFSATILLTYPFECFVAREVLKNTVLCGRPDTTAMHVSISLLLVLVTLLLSMITDCLGIVLELNGILAAVPLAYLLPAMCYCKLEQGSLFSKKKFPALLTALFGAIVAIMGTTMLIINFETASECSHGVSMSYCRDLDNTTMVEPK
ncbi:putative sodium-coupled neutral amino acid transporter 11 [Cloeon dipterum]|uniref:putative sodium-coupled neutral amino acid transporter 11 n=1 Tax=Cloeon dipterum TaxID=197152 RepID=UPI00321FD0E7